MKHDFAGRFSNSYHIFAFFQQKMETFHSLNIDTIVNLCYISPAFLGCKMAVVNLTLFAVEGEPVPSTVFLCIHLPKKTFNYPGR